MKKIFAVFAAIASAAASLAQGETPVRLELASPFSDGMVLQREMPVNVWGFARPGSKVSVAFGGSGAQAQADGSGRWKAKLPPLAACSEGRTLVAECEGERLEVRDVLVGEVWFASGQSNMDCPLVGKNTRYRDRQGALVAQMTRKPAIRYLLSSGSWKRHPLERAQSRLVWRKFVPEDLMKGRSCSAVAAYFALDLYSALEVPVGLLCAYAGGTNIDAWTPAEGTASVPELKDVAAWKYYDSGNWPTNFNTYPWRSPVQQPAVLWNGLVAPIAPYSCRGLVWYQGCHNYSQGEWQRYCSKMHALFNGWKLKFENEGFVIRFAQLATSYSTVGMMQAKFEREQPAAAMAVICDVANKDDIHPWEKETVGRRLAVHALKRDYGFAGIQDNSPRAESAVRDGTNIVVVCRDAKGLYLYNRDRSLRNNFEIAGSDGVWKDAKIVNIVPKRNAKGSVNNNGGEIASPDRIVLCADGVKEPVRVRYLFKLTQNGSIYNEVNLPMGPFELLAQ
jgi:sialate O-acetylesterase